MSTCVAARMEVLNRIMADPKWSKKLEKVKTVREYQKVLYAYARAKGLKVVVVP